MSTTRADTPTIEIVSGFISLLRNSGFSLSVSEQLDALQATEAVGFSSPKILHSTLRLVLLKQISNSELFDELFARYFAVNIQPGSTELASSTNDQHGSSSPTDSEPTLDELVEQVLTEDGSGAAAAAARAVSAYAGLDGSRRVGASYYYHRTLQQLNLSKTVEQLTTDMDDFEINDLKKNAKDLEAQIGAEIRRRLLLMTGVASAQEKSVTTADEVSFLYASAEDLQRMQKLIVPLARKLAVRLGRRRKNQAKKKLYLRGTIHSSLRTGGVPMKLEFKPRTKSKPELVVIADLSGSVASFARFTLNLLHVLSHEFSNLRSFAFVDEIDEVTKAMEGKHFGDALATVAAEANILGEDGHSNYGRAFSSFVNQYVESVKSSTTVIILGDARNNYHPAAADSLKKIAEASKAVYWLNPEPRSYWDTGDSVAGTYDAVVTETVEVRNIAQLSRFIDHRL